MPDEVVGHNRVADDGVDPYREALAGAEERLRLAVGKYGAQHGTYSGSALRSVVFQADHRGEVLAVAGLDHAAGVRSAQVTACGILTAGSSVITALNLYCLIAAIPPGHWRGCGPVPACLPIPSSR